MVASHPDRVTVHGGRITPVRRKTETLRHQRIAPFRKPTGMRAAGGVPDGNQH
jgi:hypothetical protein